VAGRDAAPRVLSAICDAVAVAVLAFLVVSRIFYTRFHLTRAFEFDRILLIALAIILILLARFAPRLNRHVLVAAATTVVLASAFSAVSVALSIDIAQSVKGVVLRAVVGQHEPNIAKPDDRYAYVLRPNARDVHREADFNVTYTVDAAGRRATPEPPHPRATVAFVGDSFTFGTGVNDEESYPWVLGAQYWRDVKVVNAGVGGWGPLQGYMTVADMLASSTPPSVVVYQMIPDDIYRSYLRNSTMADLPKRIEVVDGRLVERARPSAASRMVVTPDVVEDEVRLTRDLVLGMQTICDQHHVPFAVLLLQDNGVYPPDLIAPLGQRGIRTLDLTRMPYERFMHDYHPNAADHRHIAARIAASAIGDLVNSTRALPR
jgi:hypothetical protein